MNGPTRPIRKDQRRPLETSGRSVPSAAFFDELDRFVDSEPVGWAERPTRRPATEPLGDEPLRDAEPFRDAELSRAADHDPDGELPIDDDGAPGPASDAAFSHAPALTRREAFAQRLSEELDRPPPPAPPKAEAPRPAPDERAAASPPDAPTPRPAADPVGGPSARPSSVGAPSARPSPVGAPSARAVADPVAAPTSRTAADPLGAMRPGGEARPAAAAAAKSAASAPRMPDGPAAPRVPPAAGLAEMRTAGKPAREDAEAPPEMLDSDFIDDDDSPADALEWELDNAISEIIANRNVGGEASAPAATAPAPAAPEPAPEREAVPEAAEAAAAPAPAGPKPDGKPDTKADEQTARAAVGTKRPRPVPSFQFERRPEPEEGEEAAPADFDNPLSKIFFKDVRENFDAVHAGQADEFDTDPGFQMEDLGPDGLDDEYAFDDEDEDELPPSLSRVARRRRSGIRRASVLTAAGVCAAVIVAGVVGFNVFAGGGDASKSAPVIHANARDVKIVADNTAVDAEPDIEERTRLGETEELVMPDRVEIGRTATPSITIDDEEDAIVARRVSTMSIRPDGTIVPSGSEAPSAPARTVRTEPPVRLDDSAPVRSNELTPYDVAAVAPSATDGATPLLPDDQEASAFAPAADADVEIEAVATPDGAALEEEIEAVTPSLARPPRRPTPPVRTARTQPAAAASAPAVTQAAPAASTRNAPWGVQVSSQRSRADAEQSFANLRARYPSIVGGIEPMIIAADVRDRGLFYRVRLPANSRGEAASLCQRLKTAGADCFIGRN